LSSTWEWTYSSNPKRWTLTVGEWNAVVLLVDITRYRWRGSVERDEPKEHHDGPAYKDAATARGWCLERIAKLRADG